MEAPTSLDDAVTLIKRFYSRSGGFGDAQTHSAVDKILTELKQSQHGFQLADELLKNNDKEVRFFGANTFFDKLRGGLDGFGDEERQELRDRLLTWVVNAADNNYDRPVLTKLCACLVLYWYQMDGQWKDCVLHVLASLLSGIPSVMSPPADLNTLKQAVGALTLRRRYAIYAFLETFVQEVEFYSGSTKGRLYNDEILNNLPFLAKIVEYATDNSSTIGDECAWPATRAFNALAMWAKESLPDPEVAWDMLRPIFNSFVGALISSFDILEMVTDVLCDLLADCPAFLKPEHHAIIVAVLLTDQVDEWLRELERGDFDGEPSIIAKLLLTYCTVRVESLANDQPQHRELFERLLRITKCKGTSVLEDDIISQVIEVWSTLCENLEMVHFNSDGALNTQHWLQWYDGMLPRLSNALIEKARLPDTARMKRWSEDDKSRFTELRSDISNLMNNLYELLGHALVDHIVSFAWASKVGRDWDRVEAALNCLVNLAESIDEPENEDKAAAALLSASSPGEVPLLHLLNNEDVPLLTMRKTVTFIDAYSSVFSRHDSYLPDALNFLSRCLQVSTSLATLAAKAISTLCMIGRIRMTSILQNLFTLYESYTISPGRRETTVQERLAGALSAVIQASAVSAPSGEEWRRSDANAILSHLLTTIENDLKSAFSLLDQGAVELAREANLRALSCLRSMGKAFREPDETVIDLENDQDSRPANIWTSIPETIHSLQQRILGICSQSLIRFDGAEEIEAVCQILRAGYTESQIGPFVFPLAATESFVKQCSLSTSRIGIVLETVSVLLNKHKSSIEPEVRTLALRCLKHIRSMIRPFFHGTSNYYTNYRSNAHVIHRSSQSKRRSGSSFHCD